ncbi:hypothetical protein C5167_035502 [Papaver somniferum]|uniref:Uncharacterized protein n=1 Tax=Papaver somniferum TaxID=3469 RepID=A0A4Y7KIY3_PAPSO|nr:hypothetical protein C5167_035502 [Papaver somniferum]
MNCSWFIDYYVDELNGKIDVQYVGLQVIFLRTICHMHLGLSRLRRLPRYLVHYMVVLQIEEDIGKSCFLMRELVAPFSWVDTDLAIKIMESEVNTRKKSLYQKALGRFCMLKPGGRMGYEEDKNQPRVYSTSLARHCISLVMQQEQDHLMKENIE